MAPMLAESVRGSDWNMDFLRRLGELAQNRTMSHINQSAMAVGVAEFFTDRFQSMDELGSEDPHLPMSYSKQPVLRRRRVS